MITITKIFRFEAAHFLPCHLGKCKNVHGHSYVLEIEIEGDRNFEGPEKDMVMDFGNLSKIVNELVIDRLDHKILNDIFDNPTAECMVMEIAKWLKPYINIRTNKLARVKLWETNKCCATWKT